MIILIVVLIICRWYKNRQIARETETVDDNMYYGDEVYDKEYQKSTIMDDNDYYAL